MTFHPRMFTLAKEAAGLTQGAIAAEAGVSQALVSKIETGLEQPSGAFVTSAARACGVPIEFFEQEDAILGEGLVDFFHKKRLTLPMKPLRRANALANVTRLEVMRALRPLELTDVRPLPNLPVDEHDSVGEIAQKVRAVWRTPPGPLADLVALAEAAAIPVFPLPLGHEKLAAVSMPGIEAGRHIIALNSGLPASAQRFALAHEIGHFVMHQGTATEDMEKEADRFASALLMPAVDIKGQLRNVRFRDLGNLKNIWRVSLAALIYRAHDLEVISDRHYRTLNIQLNKLPGGRKREPGEFPPEIPRLMKHVIDHYRSDLGYTLSDLARTMVIDEDTLREKFLGEQHRTLRAVRPAGKAHRLSVVP